MEKQDIKRDKLTDKAFTRLIIISVLGICGLRILWIYTIFQIPALHTPQCLFLSYPISWIVTMIAQMILFFHVRNKFLRKDISEI